MYKKGLLCKMLQESICFKFMQPATLQDGIPKEASRCAILASYPTSSLSPCGPINNRDEKAQRQAMQLNVEMFSCFRKA